MLDLTYRLAGARGLVYLQEAGPPVKDNTSNILMAVVLVVVGIAFIFVFRKFWVDTSTLWKKLRGRSEPLDAPSKPVSPPRFENQAGTSERTSPGTSHGDIFISYASADRPTAEALAATLSSRGWSVWWDRTIPPGMSFDEVIEAALTAAKCVIVLWSRASITSDWVKVEAAEAARRRILIPALIEEVTIPLEFRRLQAADLVGWQGSSQHAGLQSLMGSVVSVLGMPGARSASP